MIMDPSYKSDLMDGIRDLPADIFAKHGTDKAALLNDDGLLDTLWAQYQKSIEEYDVDADYALKDALHETLNIPMEAWMGDPVDYPQVVYIAAPYAGDVEANVAFAKQAALYAMSAHCVPFVPHLQFPAFLDDNVPNQRALGIQANLELLRRCDELWVFNYKGISAGMQQEITYADQHSIPVKYISLFSFENIKLPDA